ncbi:MAG: hypothetical protein JXA50_08415, partial [Deltaproteobacteria bacterium]|nr:hypothetical protein [Deltaproteobacteria bacterium]
RYSIEAPWHLKPPGLSLNQAVRFSGGRSMCPIIAFFALAFYAVPMGIVLKFLRSTRVKEAMQ